MRKWFIGMVVLAAAVLAAAFGFAHYAEQAAPEPKETRVEIEYAL